MTLKKDGSFQSMCGTLEKTIVNWYTKEYFLLRTFDIDFGLKKHLMIYKKKTEYQTDKQIIGKSMFV